MEAVRGRWSVVRGCGRLGAELQSNTCLQSIVGIQREFQPKSLPPLPAPRPKADPRQWRAVELV
jgi:hypothetical protein